MRFCTPVRKFNGSSPPSFTEVAQRERQNRFFLPKANQFNMCNQNDFDLEKSQECPLCGKNGTGKAISDALTEYPGSIVIKTYRTLLELAIENEGFTLLDSNERSNAYAILWRLNRIFMILEGHFGHQDPDLDHHFEVMMG